jgi:hypothetical protein
VVERHLDDELGAQLAPLELAVVGPAARLARPGVAGLVRREAVDERALLLGREAARVADLAQVPSSP